MDLPLQCIIFSQFFKLIFLLVPEAYTGSPVAQLLPHLTLELSRIEVLTMARVA